MTTLLENPMPVIVLGIFVEALLAAIFVSTGRRVIPLAMLGVLMLVLAAVGLERWWVTDVEQVEATLDGAVEALEANDLKLLLEGYVSPRALRTRARAADASQRIRITSAKIRNLDIKVNRLANPPTAEAQFYGVVHFESRMETFPDRHYPARFLVELRLEGDRWLITDRVKWREHR